MAESPENLIKMMDTFYVWTDEYGSTVNVDKTKVVIFRPSLQKPIVVFLYNNEVEIVDSFSYLGLLMHLNGKFNTTQNISQTKPRNLYLCCLKKSPNIICASS